MPQADVVIVWFSESPELTDVMATAFKRPTKLIALPSGFIPVFDADKKPVLDANGKQKMGRRDYDAELKAYGTKPLRSVIAKMLPGIDPLRVCLIGFSQGCQGVRAALRWGESNRVDAVIPVDGMHAGLAGPDHTKMAAADVTPYVAFGAAAREQGRLMVVSTSSIVPGGDIASTTQTANFLWRAVTGQDADIQEHDLPPGFWAHEEVPPVTIKFQCVKPITYVQGVTYRYRNVGGLSIVNYANLDPTGCADHIYQARHVLPLIVSTLLADRWNAQPPTEGVCLIA